jgi:hypothetical protein
LCEIKTKYAQTNGGFVAITRNIIILIIVFIGTLHAQINDGLDNRTEISLAGSLMIEKQATVAFQAGLGKFVSNYVEFGPNVSIVKIGSNDVIGNANAFISFHLTSKSPLPYVGVQGGYAWGPEYGTPTVGGYCGIKWLLGNTFLSFQPSFQIPLAEDGKSYFAIFLGTSFVL